MNLTLKLLALSKKWWCHSCLSAWFVRHACWFETNMSYLSWKSVPVHLLCRDITHIYLACFQRCITVNIICYSGSHKMKVATLTLFTVAMRTHSAQFFVTHRICYEIRGDHVTNFPIATIHLELITSSVSWQVMLWTPDHVPAYIVGLTSHEGSPDNCKDELKIERHRRAPVPCAWT